jgi:hypothetical protein
MIGRGCARWMVLAGLCVLRSADAFAQPSTVTAGQRLMDIRFATDRNARVRLQPVGLARLANGLVAVADAASLTVQYVDSAGHVVYRAAGAGRTTGRVMSLSWLGRCSADSVFVFDYVMQRVSVFDARGRFGRSFKPQGDPAIVACSGHGSFVMLSRPVAFPVNPTRGGRIRSVLLIADARGAVVRHLGLVNAYDFDPRSGLMHPRPLGRATSVALSRHSLYVGTADSGAVTAISLAHARRVSLAVGSGGHRPTITGFVKAAEIASMLQSDLYARQAARKGLLRAMLPQRTPPYSAVLTDREGTLWAVLSAPGDSITELRRVDSEGRVLRHVLIPVDLTVYEVDPRYVLGVQWEGNGRGRIVMVRIPPARVASR